MSKSFSTREQEESKDYNQVEIGERNAFEIEDTDTVGLVDYSKRKSKKSVLRRFGRQTCRFFYNGCCSLLAFLVIFTIFAHLSDSLWLFMNKKELNQRFGIKPINEIQELTPGADFTVLLITQNRDTYKEAMPKWMEIKTDKKVQYMLLDFESNPKIEFKVPNLHVVRKEQISPGVHTKYNKWEGLAFAMNYIKSPKVFYFDSCNYGDVNNFNFETYTETGANYYYRNFDRGYGGNFLASREDVQRLVEDFPLHIVTDFRTFFGEDWFLSWYFNSRKGSDVLIHMQHEALANYNKLLPETVVLWRLFMYINRYGRIVDAKKDPLGEGRCDCDKAIAFCDYGGIIAKIVALPGIYHLVDAILKMEWIFKLFIYAMEHLDSWPKSVFYVLVSLFILWCTIAWFVKKAYRVLRRKLRKLYKK